MGRGRGGPYVPFKPAFFSPCLPKPKPLDDPSAAGFPPKSEGRNLELGVARSPVCMGRVPAASSSSLPPFLHARMLRLALAFSRKMRPRVMFRHPTEKRRKALTSVNVPMWCERIVAPMLHDPQFPGRKKDE